MANSNSQSISREEEAQLMKKDFFKALIVDITFLALLVALYFLNRQYGFLDQLINKF